MPWVDEGGGVTSWVDDTPFVEAGELPAVPTSPSPFLYVGGPSGFMPTNVSPFAPSPLTAAGLLGGFGAAPSGPAFGTLSPPGAAWYGVWPSIPVPAAGRSALALTAGGGDYDDDDQGLLSRINEWVVPGAASLTDVLVLGMKANPVVLGASQAASLGAGIGKMAAMLPMMMIMMLMNNNGKRRR